MEEFVKNAWQRSKVLLKGVIIGIVALLLLIPAHFVQDLILERQARQQDAFSEISGKWAGKQNVIGPILIIPYQIKASASVSGTSGYAYFLPDKLNISATVNPEKRYRGIYEVMLYNSSTTFTGSFGQLPLTNLNLSTEDLSWDRAVIVIGISDMKGINDDASLSWNDSSITLTPNYTANSISKAGLAGPVSIASSRIKDILFKTTISLKGSQQLLFTPVGKQTAIHMQSAWPDPSFTGPELPEVSDVNNKGFSASWKNSANTRSYPQAWRDNSFDLSSAAIGTDLYISINSYQKIIRSVKYAVLCILLTFTAFFLIETNNKKSVHPLHYALTGCALILFYTLLLSFSEYIGFNAAYAISSVATIGLIGWFVKDLLNSSRLSLLLSFVLVLLYAYIFTILQLQDYALILGSVGLFITLAVVMFYSRKAQW